MIKDPTQYWLIKTNQAWKILVSLLLMLLVLLMFVAKIMIINRIWMPSWINEIELMLGEIILGFGSLIWLCRSVKCPHCGYRPVWPILRSAPAGEWLRRITRLEQCPSCKK
ncbi:MAG: hypothetical protein HZC18_08210 [Candidatus Omnitrophica bacterium]|nr:hypothetical protein [Candidatus Omnitrophota bacterium]